MSLVATICAALAIFCAANAFHAHSMFDTAVWSVPAASWLSCSLREVINELT